MDAVRILVTGGTIDKVHDWKNERLDFSDDGESRVPLMLQHARCSFPEIERILRKDSLELLDSDRQLIAEAVRRAPEKRLVITHGTSTMAETARFLHGLNLGKVIVITGAMQPSSIIDSDAPFNVGAAIAAVQLLPVGVFGTMNGRVLNAETMEKNVDLGRFDV